MMLGSFGTVVDATQPDKCGVYTITTLPKRDRFTEDRDALFTQMRFEADMRLRDSRRFDVRDAARWTAP